MTRTFTKCTALALLLALLLSLAACGGGDDTPAVDGNDLLRVCLEQIRFASPLEDMGEDSAFYFSDLPEGAAVTLYSGSGVYADRLILVTLADAGGQKAARAAVDAHLAELRAQCVNYHPEEVAKVDAALFRSEGTYLLACVTADTEYAAYVLDNAAEFIAQLPDEPPASDPLPTDTEPAATDTEPEATDTDPIPTDTEPEVTDTAPPPADTSVSTSGEYPKLTSQSGTIVPYGDGSVIRVDNMAYEMYYFSGKGTDKYAEVVNRAVASMSDFADVYVIAIPTAMGIVLPDDIQAQMSNYTDQGKCIQTVFSKLDPAAIGVNVYPNMMAHRDKYLYFRTDYHWNGRGAYYAYEAFCQTKGVTPYTLEQRELQCFDGFTGALYLKHCDQDPALELDTVEAFHPYFDGISMTYTDVSGNSYKWNVISNVSKWKASAKYSAFAGGDNPYTEYFNPNVTDGSVAVVVKESYGNALIPYLVDHYSALYEIDYRYWNGDLAEFARSVGADDVIFANNLVMMGSTYLIGMLSDNIS